MKEQLPVTSTVPAALAAASIFLSLFLLPGAGTSVRSSAVAPALRLVAGDVAMVVQSPVRAVTTAQKAKLAASHPAVAAVTSKRTEPVVTASRTRIAPAHRVVHHRRVPRKPVAATPPVKAPAAPAPKVIAQPVKHSHGKAKALGHVKKANGPKHVPGTAALSTAAGKAAQSAAPKGGRGQARGRAVDVPHGLPTVPPGHEKGGQSAGPHSAAPSGRGAGK